MNKRLMLTSCLSLGWIQAIAFGQQTAPAITGAGHTSDAAAAGAVMVVKQETGGATGRSMFDEVDMLFKITPLKTWLLLLGLIIGAVAIGRVLTFLLLRFNKRLERRGWHSQAEVFSGLASPANLAIFTLALSIGFNELTKSPELIQLKDFSKRTLVLLYTIAVFWYAFNLVAVLEVALRRITARTETTLDDDLVPVIRKSLRIFIVVIGALFILQNVFDRDIGAWLAGLGIAGLAVSLAAQDSLKNLFGSITILFDRPFTKGQRIKFHGFDGTVEEIGFRSTKVRTGDGTVVTIPNSNIVNDPVDNWAARSKIRRVLNVTLTYDTPPAKVREALAIIRGMFTSADFRNAIHDSDAVANTDPPRAFFDEFNAESLNIKVYYWFRPADWWLYLEFTERFNLKLMEEFERAGIEFAFPTRTLFLANDPKRKLLVQNERTLPD